MIRAYKIFFIFLVSLLLSTPLINHLTRSSDTNNFENRALSKAPKFPNKLTEVKAYTTQVENFLDDHFGLRESIIKKANQIRFSLFNEVLSKQITIGKNEFLFFNSHSAENPNSLIKSVCGVNQPSHERLAEIKTWIKNVYTFFESTNIVFDLAIIPTKSKVYPELLPNPAKQWCRNNTKTWIDTMFSANSKHKPIYPLNDFLQWKNDFKVYLPNHFHWSGRTPYLVARKIMVENWGFSNLIDVDKIETDKPTDLKQHLNGLNLSSKADLFNYAELLVKDCKGINCIESLTRYYRNGNSFHFKTKDSNSKTLLLISDSFGADISPHFAAGFENVHLININNLTKEELNPFFNWVIKELSPTHLLFLFHDDGLNWNSLKLKSLTQNLIINDK